MPDHSSAGAFFNYCCSVYSPGEVLGDGGPRNLKVETLSTSCPFMRSRVGSALCKSSTCKKEVSKENIFCSAQLSLMSHTRANFIGKKNTVIYFIACWKSGILKIWGDAELLHSFGFNACFLRGFVTPHLTKKNTFKFITQKNCDMRHYWKLEKKVVL